MRSRHASRSLVVAIAAMIVGTGCSSDPTSLPASTSPPSTSPVSTGPVSTGPVSTGPVSTGPVSTGDSTAPTGPDTPNTGQVVDTAATGRGPTSSLPEVSSPSSGGDTPAAATRALFVDVAGGDPGCSVAVGREGQPVFAEAYGSASLVPSVAMSPDTVVDIGSTSKQFTATAIALLAERGEVDLDEVLMSYVPGLPEWAGLVTLRQMLHHTSGIPDYVGLLVDSGIDYSTRSTDADALNVLAEAIELDFEPGTSWEYSNSNYFLLGQVVLEVTGDDLASFLASEVFGPLRLDAVMDPVGDIAAKATSYEQVGGQWVVADSPWEQTGDGGVQTTPSELVRWAAQYWSPSIGESDINALRLDDAVATDQDGERYGFGIIDTTFEGERILEHSGSWAGFATSFVVAPDQHLAVAVTCTSNETVPESNGTDIGFDVLALWLQ